MCQNFASFWMTLAKIKIKSQNSTTFDQIKQKLDVYFVLGLELDNYILLAPIGRR